MILNSLILEFSFCISILRIPFISMMPAQIYAIWAACIFEKVPALFCACRYIFRPIELNAAITKTLKKNACATHVFDWCGCIFSPIFALGLHDVKMHYTSKSKLSALQRNHYCIDVNLSLMIFVLNNGNLYRDQKVLLFFLVFLYYILARDSPHLSKSFLKSNPLQSAL